MYIENPRILRCVGGWSNERNQYVLTAFCDVCGGHVTHGKAPEENKRIIRRAHCKCGDAYQLVPHVLFKDNEIRYHRKWKENAKILEFILSTPQGD
jgi:biotin synthase-related radical SAM superfamily protein